MNNCLVTKLKGVVSNDSLLKLGEVKISFTDKGTGSFSVYYDEEADLEITGASFKNEENTVLGNTMKANAGVQTKVFPTSRPCTISLFNKYAITKISSSGNGFDVDLVQFLQCKRMTSVFLNETQVHGNINGLSLMSNLTGIGLNTTNVSGDLSSLLHKTQLTYLNLGNTKVSGDISAIAGNKGLTSLIVSNTKINGDISVLSDLTELTLFSAYSNNLSGNINTLGRLTKLSEINFGGTLVTGEVKELGSAMHSNGKVSGTFQLVLNDRITYNGATNNGKRVTMTFSTSNVSYAISE